jgi:manganese oxidase
VVMGKTMSFRYADGFPLENINGQPFVPEDNQDPSDMSLNYGVEPLWFRFNRPVMAPFGHANGAGFGDVINAHEAYSNNLVDTASGQAIGDPATPVFVASAGHPYRMHLVNPHGASRGSTFIVHGHVWQRYPYLAQNVDINGFPNGVGGVGGVGSVAIGNNPLSFYQGAQESFNPYAHFDLVFPSAGGENAVRGDYLFRDLGSFGNSGGLWGIVRVQ